MESNELLPPAEERGMAAALAVLKKSVSQCTGFRERIRRGSAVRGSVQWPGHVAIQWPIPHNTRAITMARTIASTVTGTMASTIARGPVQWPVHLPIQWPIPWPIQEEIQSPEQ